MLPTTVKYVTEHTLSVMKSRAWVKSCHNERNFTIFKERVNNKRTLASLAKQYNITPERVRQIEGRGYRVYYQLVEDSRRNI